MVGTLRAGERPARILVVDDDDYVGHTFEAMLRDLRLEIDRAGTAADGLARARARNPDLVLVDIGLPDEDGLALTRRLRAEPDLAATRIVVVTGHKLEPGEAHAAGADATIEKPVRLEDLRTVVAGQLVARRAGDDAGRP